MGAIHSRKFKAVFLLLIASSLIATVQGTEPAAQTGRYVFCPDQSTLVQTGGFAGVHWTYTIEGQFCLIVDSEAGTARFEQVDANAIDDSEPMRTLDPNKAFNLAGLIGTVVDDTTIEFAGQAANEIDVRLRLTFENDTVHLTGETTPPPNSADFFLLSLDAVATRQYAGGTGDPNRPYRIATAEDLVLLGESPEDYDRHFIMTVDIDLDPNLPGRKVFDRAVIAPDTNDVEDFFQGIPFTGVFDGNGHTISHLTINGGGHLGLFGRMEDAVIGDLGLEEVDISGDRETIGALAGTNSDNGRITTSYSTGTVVGVTCIGGLVGFNNGLIASCYSASTVTGDRDLGGLAGQNGGTITTSYSTGRVNGTQEVGGLVGSNSIGSIIACYSTSPVGGTGKVGGLVGYSYGSITMSYSAGAVTGNSDVGGLVGNNQRRAVGRRDKFTYGSVIASFWDTETSGQATSAGGIGKTTAEMQDSITFLVEGWDLVEETGNGTCDYWQLSPGAYPSLRYHIGDRPVMPEGLGTTEEPYLIRDAQDLGTLWAEPRAHCRLEASLDLSGITWRAAVVPWFAGVFDGNGFAIENLQIEGGGDLGLFGRATSETRISRLGLEAVDINGTGDHIGSIVGRIDGDISTCYSTGSIHGNQDVGGLMGMAGGTTTSCRSAGAVSGNQDVGGLAGSNGGSAAHCYSNGSVTGNETVGGLVGINCMGSSLTASYTTGAVTGNEHVGGLAGVSNGSITTCCSTGPVSGDSYIGGLTGGNYDGTISNSYSTSEVRGFSHVGGLVANNHGTITTSYSAGSIHGVGHVGGLVGSTDATVTASFWDIETSGQAVSEGGTGLSTAEMQSDVTFLDAGWDFMDETDNGTEDIWWIIEGRDYPSLWWELD